MEASRIQVGDAVFRKGQVGLWRVVGHEHHGTQLVRYIMPAGEREPDVVRVRPDELLRADIGNPELDRTGTPCKHQRKPQDREAVLFSLRRDYMMRWGSYPTTYRESRALARASAQQIQAEVEAAQSGQPIAPARVLVIPIPHGWEPSIPRVWDGMTWREGSVKLMPKD